MNSGIRVTCVEPGFVTTELQSHNEHPMVVEGLEKMREEIGEPLEAEDIAEAIRWAVTQPDRVNVNEVLVRPTGQKR
jgi:NADP-dependent 3-hydroxy acid dehydrogenase YdfG